LSPPINDPYATLGVSATATDAELRAAYRRLVQQHHPDHNRGSTESARRFEEIQEAYARVRERRAQPPGGATGARRAGSTTGARNTSSASTSASGDVEDRIAAMEREVREAAQARERDLREARAARDRAAQVARDAAAAATADGSDPAERRASEEQLGIYSTDDSFSKIIADARDEISDLFGRAVSAAERTAEQAAKLAAEQAAKRSRDRSD
jgi:curved DNA-binding protein CbpA